MPIERDFRQGTASWRRWRMGGIGASDAPVIMGESPWTTPYELWLQKTHRVGETRPNWQMRRGSALEADARSLYIDLTGTFIEPVCLEHARHPWLRASLDGFSRNGRLVVEIKCPGRADHEVALDGCVPSKYYPQLQHLLMVSGAAECHYASYRDDRLVIVPVALDWHYCDELFYAERDFWDCVCCDEPPD